MTATILLFVIGIAVVVSVTATLIALARDGYGPIPTDYSRPGTTVQRRRRRERKPSSRRAASVRSGVRPATQPACSS